MSDQQYDNTNSGVLFPNNYKDNPKQPDLRGDLDIEGVAYKLAAWARTANETGERFLSLKVELKEKPQSANDADPIGDLMADSVSHQEQPAEPTVPTSALPPSDDGGEDVPF